MSNQFYSIFSWNIITKKPLKLPKKSTAQKFWIVTADTI